jgi:hypothetical protein
MTQILTAKNIVRYGSGILLFLIIGGYSIWQGRDILFGIRLIVHEISDGQSFTESILPLSGKATHAINITINGRTVPTAEDGSWQDMIALEPGYNTLTITATDKFKKTITKEFRLYYKAPPPPDPIIPPEEIVPDTIDTIDTATKNTPLR